MRTAAIAPEQMRAIHAIRRRTRLDEGSYRAMLQAYGVATSKDLTWADADRLLRVLRDIPGASKPVEQRGRAKAEGECRRKLQAMWIALWNLGVIQDRRDTALHAFVESQTGISHTRFLTNWDDAAPVIEALKAMLERAGVFWPARTGDPGLDLLAMKREIIRAQWRRCVALGAVLVFPGMDPDDAMERFVSKVARGNPRALGSLDCPSATKEELDAAAKELGRRIRKAQEEDAEVRHVG